jgi:predicted nucleic acid-binding protein
MMLKDLPKRSEIFIDSNVFTYYLSGHEIFGVTCKNFLRLIERGECKGYVNDVVISEVLLNFLKSELFRLRKIEPYKVVREIKKNPNLVGLVDFTKVTLLFNSLGLEIISSGFRCKKITEIMKKYKLLPNDSIHIATMEKYEIKNIATKDSDFERVKWIRVWKP